MARPTQFPSPNNWRIDAGKMDRRIQLLRPQMSESGDEFIGWETIAEVWAYVQPDVGLERNEAGRTVAIASVLVAMRWRPDIDTRCRVRDGEKEYEILAALDVLRKHVQIDLSCLEVT